MQGRFALTSSPRLKKATEVQSKSPKKRSLKRTPTKSPTITKSDLVESTPPPKEKTEPLSPYQTQKPKVASETIKQNTQKRDPRRELEREYERLATTYSRELEKREQLIKEGEQLDQEIENQKHKDKEN